jgi:hypothetical protein
MQPIPRHDDAHKLTALIAEAKARKTIKAAELNRFRGVLLKERKTGTSVRIMAESLAKMGVVVSEETLRQWFVRQEEPRLSRKSVRIPVRKLAVSPIMPSDSVATTTVGPRVARTDI